MKTETRMIETKIFVADDGKEFDSAKRCAEYEKKKHSKEEFSKIKRIDLYSTSTNIPHAWFYIENDWQLELVLKEFSIDGEYIDVPEGTTGWVGVESEHVYTLRHITNYLDGLKSNSEAQIENQKAFIGRIEDDLNLLTAKICKAINDFMPLEKKEKELEKSLANFFKEE